MITDKKYAKRSENADFCDFTSEHWTHIGTNNEIERLNREIYHRTRMENSFPDDNSSLMLACTRLPHVAGTRWGHKKYLNMKHLEAALGSAFTAG